MGSIKRVGWERKLSLCQSTLCLVLLLFYFNGDQLLPKCKNKYICNIFQVKHSACPLLPNCPHSSEEEANEESSGLSAELLISRDGDPNVCRGTKYGDQSSGSGAAMVLLLLFPG